MKIEEINSLSRGEFVERLGWVFEHSPWVAERAWVGRPFDSMSHLHKVMVEEVGRASQQEQAALLYAHPDLGTRAKLSAASAGEQAGVGLDQLTRAEYESLQQMNRSYRQKFGFPFLFAVKGSNKHDILKALELRLSSTPEEEFRVALEQVYRIAGFRLEDGRS